MSISRTSLLAAAACGIACLSQPFGADDALAQKVAPPSAAVPAATPPPAFGAAPSSPTPAAAAPASTPPALMPVPLKEAIQRAAVALMANAPLPASAQEVRDLVVDPLIDGHTGGQNAATVQMGIAITDMVRTTYSRYRVVPFTSSNVAKQPLALIGTFRPVNTKGIVNEQPDAFHICLALLDLKSGQVLSKGVARAVPEGVDATPTPFFREAPLWVADPAVNGYVRTCQTTKAGDQIDPNYANRVAVATLISDGVNAYNNRKYRDALDLYRLALKSPGGDQPRVHSGIYLASWKLKQVPEATKAFGALVDQGLKAQKLSAQLLFNPASPIFPAKAQAEYDLWLRAIAERAAASDTCLEIVGHTSRAGLPALNEVLSVRRAEFVRQRLIDKAPKLSERTIASGVGSREAIVGTTPDSPHNAIDRRVEFKSIKCA